MIHYSKWESSPTFSTSYEITANLNNGFLVVSLPYHCSITTVDIWAVGFYWTSSYSYTDALRYTRGQWKTWIIYCGFFMVGSGDIHVCVYYHDKARVTRLVWSERNRTAEGSYLNNGMDFKINIQWRMRRSLISHAKELTWLYHQSFYSNLCY